MDWIELNGFWLLLLKRYSSLIQYLLATFPLLFIPPHSSPQLPSLPDALANERASLQKRDTLNTWPNEETHRKVWTKPIPFTLTKESNGPRVQPHSIKYPLLSYDTEK